MCAPNFLQETSGQQTWTDDFNLGGPSLPRCLPCLAARPDHFIRPGSRQFLYIRLMSLDACE